MKKIYALLLVLTMYSAFGQDGSLDTSWSTTVGGWDFALDPSNNIYAGGLTLYKVTSTGAPAPGFTPPPSMGYESNRVFYHNEGSVFVGGPFVNYNGTGKNYVLKFNATTGALVSGFTAALPINTQVVSISQLPNGRLLVGAMAYGIAGPTISKSFFCLNQTTGAIDMSFNNGSNGISTALSVWDITRDENNNTILVGNFSHYNSSQRDGIAKINQDGSLLPFAFLGKNPTGLIQSVSVQKNNGAIVIGGDFTHIPSGRKNLLRIKSDGSLDTSFNPQIEGIGGRIEKVLVLSSGKVIIMGYFQSIGGVPRPGIARLNIDGTLDTCFDPGTGPKDGTTPVYNEFARLDSKEDLFIAWGGSTFNEIPVNGMVKLKNKPVVLVANPDAATVTKGTTTVTAVPNVLVNDTINLLPATTSNVTISQDGLYPGGISLDALTGAVKVAPSVVPGTYTISYKICPKNSMCNCVTTTVTLTVKAPLVPIIANDDNGSAYSGLTAVVLNLLGNDKYGTDPAIWSNIKISPLSQSATDFFIINTTTNDASLGNVAVKSTTPAGTYIFTYQICDKNNPVNCDSATVTITIISSEIVNGIRANNIVRNSGLQTTANIIITGSFSAYNNISTMGIARLNPNLTLDTSFNSTGPIPATDIPRDFRIQPDNKIVVVGQFTGFSQGATGRGIARLLGNGDLDPQFNVGGSGVTGEGGGIFGMCLQSDNKIIIGGPFLYYNGVARKYIARINTNGSIDTSFDPGAGFGSVPHGMVAQSDGKIVVVGKFISYQGTTARGIIRLNSNGSIDTNFLTQTGTGLTGFGGDTMTVKVFLQPDGKIIVIGDFTAYNGVSRRGIVRINPNGLIDTGFVPGVFNNLIRTLALTPNGQMFIGGDFTTYNGTAVNSIVRLNANGSFDGTFDTGTGPAGSVWTLTRQPFDGKVIVGGLFATYNGIAAGNITRIAPGIPGSQSRETLTWKSEPEIDINFMQNNSIAIYPNPSEGIFNIDFKGYEYEKFDMTIHNALGQLIYQGIVTPQNTNQIDLSKFDGGSYFVKLQNNNETINKIIVKK